jgi:hypothetical protein
MNIKNVLRYLPTNPWYQLMRSPRNDSKFGPSNVVCFYNGVFIGCSFQPYGRQYLKLLSKHEQNAERKNNQPN